VGRSRADRQADTEDNFLGSGRHGGDSHDLRRLFDHYDNLDDTLVPFSVRFNDGRLGNA